MDRELCLFTIVDSEEENNVVWGVKVKAEAEKNELAKELLEKFNNVKIQLMLMLWTDRLYSPKFHMLKLRIGCDIPQCDSFWSWGLWEIIRLRWEHEGGAFLMGLVALKEADERPGLSLLLFTHKDRDMWTHRCQLSASQEDGYNQKPHLLASGPWT